MNAVPSDYNDLARIGGADAIAQCIDEASTPERYAPEPLRRPLAPGADFPLDALGPVLAPAAEAIHEVVKSPAAICGQSVLAAASLAAQPHAKIAIDGRRHPLSLWVISVAESGDRKSACDGPALHAHREYERAEMAKYKQEFEEYRVKLAAWKAVHDKTKKGQTEEAIRQEYAACGSPPDEPLQPLLMASDPTLEGLHKLLMRGRGSVGVFTDEGGVFVGGHGMSAENATKTAAGFSSLWDRGEADRIRGGDGAVKIYGKCVALHLMLQPVIAEQVLSNKLLSGQGFLARSLIAWPRSLAGTRVYNSVDLSQDPRMGRYWGSMTSLLQKPVRIADGTQNEIDPPLISLTGDAKALWVKAHDSIEALQQPEGEYAEIRPWASKAAEQILRIAGVLTLTADPEATRITATEIEAAATLMDYYLGEALRLKGVAETDPDIRAAEALLEWCWENSRKHVHSGELLRLGPNKVRDSKALYRATDILERTNWLLPVEGGMSLGGSMRKRAWTVVSSRPY